MKCLFLIKEQLERERERMNEVKVQLNGKVGWKQGMAKAEE
jgi:hypothetical protein